MPVCMTKESYTKESYLERIEDCMEQLVQISNSKVLGDGTKETWACSASAMLLADLRDRVKRIPERRKSPWMKLHSKRLVSALLKNVLKR